jgi:pyrophosphatase PpaX
LTPGSRQTYLSLVAQYSDQLAITGGRGVPRGITTVVFDFDDTIADTLPAREDAMRRTFETAGVSTLDIEEYMRSQRGVPLQVALDAFDNGRGSKMDLLDIYRTAYWHRGPGFVFTYEGVPEMLSGLLAAGLRMGVLTSKAHNIDVGGRQAGTVVELEELGLSSMFERTVGYEDVMQPKPHPEGLNMLLEVLGATPEQTLVVGDSFADIATAHNGGCWSCLAGWGVPPDQRPDVIADVVAEHPSAVLSMLTR